MIVQVFYIWQRSFVGGGSAGETVVEAPIPLRFFTPIGDNGVIGVPE